MGSGILGHRAPFEQLPNEIRDTIASNLSFGDCTTLACVSEFLGSSLHPFLFAKPGHCDRTLTVACVRGNLRLVRIAVAHGAGVKAAAVGFDIEGHAHLVFPLRLALKSRNLAIFRLLLSHGATPAAFVAEANRHGMQDHKTRRETSGLLQSLARQHNMEFLHACFDSNVLTRTDIQDCIGYAIEGALKSGKIPHGLLRYLQSRGAEVCLLRNQWGGDRLLLTRAVERGLPELVMELLDLGADVNGKQEGTLCSRRILRQIPIFAAARRMATDGPQMVQQLLDRGADPHHVVMVTEHYTPTGPWRRSAPWTEAKLHYTDSLLPVHAYLEAVNFAAEMPLSAAEGLEFWIDRGARFHKGIVGEAVDGEAVDEETRLLRRSNIVTRLLDKWGPGMLQNDDFHFVIQALKPELTEKLINGLRDCISRHRFPSGIALARWEAMFTS